jgi:putative membrane protein
MSLRLLTDWGFEPAIWLSIVAAALLYGIGTWRVWGRAGHGHGIRPKQAACFAAGLLAIVLALMSPIDHLAEDLLSAHMVQHLLLILAAAPLLVLGAPQTAFAWALPRNPRLAAARRLHGARRLRAVWRWITRPAAAWSLHVGTLLAWHLPGLYQAALANDAVHALEHLMFLGTAFTFWWALLRMGRTGRLSYGLGVLYVFGAGLAESGLGALMLFSDQVWYPAYAATTPGYGLSALTDQQLAGVIMWVPPSVVMLGIAVAMFLAWLRAIEAHMRQLEGGRAYPGAGRAPAAHDLVQAEAEPSGRL